MDAGFCVVAVRKVWAFVRWYNVNYELEPYSRRSVEPHLGQASRLAHEPQAHFDIIIEPVPRRSYFAVAATVATVLAVGWYLARHRF
jgi:hypothetical protein